MSEAPTPTRSRSAWSRSLNLLFLTQTYPRFEEDTSGPFIRDLARALVAGGDRVTVVTPHTAGLPERWQDGGVEVATFRYAPERLEVLGYSRSLSKDETIRWQAGAVTPLYLLAARRAAARHVARGGYDLLHAHWIVPNGLAAAPLARRLPLAVGLHGSDVFLAERALVRRWVRGTLARTSILTGCSPELVARVCALGLDASAARVIPYGVDPRSFSPEPGRGKEWRRRLGIPDSAQVVLTVGRMVTKKGYHVLLEALGPVLSTRREAHVIFAGGGDRLEEFRARSAAWPGRVHFPGRVLRDTLPDLYRAADLFVLPAVHDAKGNVDGLPNVILEAMASGLGVVASGISGIPLAVEPGVNGRLVPERDPEALAAALIDALGDPDALRRMGRASRERVERELNWPAIAARYRDAYGYALDARRGARASAEVRE